jgi:hypothetical protein
MRKSFWVILSIGFGAVACTVSPAANKGAQDDAGDCTQSGSSACESTLNALCARWVQCCDAPGAPSCQPWATNVSECLAYWVSAGYDCSSSTYADWDVCSGTTSQCQNDIPLVACSDMYGATANWPASCTTFWQQFPAPATTTTPPTWTPGTGEDAGDDSCTQSGSTACDDTLTALCTRWVQCCDSDEAPDCQSWATDVEQCQEYWVGAGYDCSSSTYSGWDVCASTTTTCENDISLISCSDMYGATANWPSSCITFWQQFQ